MNLNQVTVPAIDIQKSITFYEKLGLDLIVHIHDGYARFECPGGDSTFSVHRVSQVSEGEKPVIYFECEDLDQKVSDLIGAGLTFEE